MIHNVPLGPGDLCPIVQCEECESVLTHFYYLLVVTLDGATDFKCGSRVHCGLPTHFQLKYLGMKGGKQGGRWICDEQLIGGGRKGG